MATPVGETQIAKMIEIWDKREAAKQEKAKLAQERRSASRSAERGPQNREDSGAQAAEEVESQ